MNLSFYEALDRIPLGAAVTIEFMGPLAVAVAGSRRPLDVLWVVLATAGIALLSSVIPYSLELEALRHLPKRVFGVLMSLEPAMAAIAGLIVLGEGLSVREAVAIGLVVTASTGAAAAGRAAPQRPLDA